MKYLMMVVSTMMWMTIGVVLSNTIYAEGGRIKRVGDFYVVLNSDKPTDHVMNTKHDRSSQIVY
jgi:hypothetical protein